MTDQNGCQLSYKISLPIKPVSSLPSHSVPSISTQASSTSNIVVTSVALSVSVTSTPTAGISKQSNQSYKPKNSQNVFDLSKIWNSIT